MGDDDAAQMTTPSRWRRFLENYSALWLSDNEDHRHEQVLDEWQMASGWLGRDPADESTVVAAERRLGVRFPPTLRGFLLASDGWSGVGGWVDRVLPCAELAWFRDTEPGRELLATYVDIHGDEPDVEFEDDDPIPVFRRTILVAYGEDVWLVDPQDTDGEWPACEFAPKYGEFAWFDSFAALFDDSRETMEIG